jgi:PAS domain-containing protein
MIFSTQRELAFLNSNSSGVGLPPSRFGPAGINRDGHHAVSQFQREFENSPHLYLVLDPRPGLHIIDVNDAYARATMTTRAVVAGERLFNVFPDNPDDPFADGVSNLYASLRSAAETGRPHAMQMQRYDLRCPDGKFVERYWRPVNSPVFDDKGRLSYLLHHAEDVTSEVLLSSQSRP